MLLLRRTSICSLAWCRESAVGCLDGAGGCAGGGQLPLGAIRKPVHRRDRTIGARAGGAPHLCRMHTNEDMKTSFKRAAVPYLVIGWHRDPLFVILAAGSMGPANWKGALRCDTSQSCVPAGSVADPLDVHLPGDASPDRCSECLLECLRVRARATRLYATDSIGAGNINQLGQLLYTEKSTIKAVAPQFYAFQPPPLPADLGTELWLATPQAPLTRRLIPNGGLLSSIQWSGPATFCRARRCTSLVQGTRSRA